MTPIDNTMDTHEFDHVLIDVNQLLHVSLRRARNEGHGLTMALKELDKCLALATPKKSVVLAFDGPPSAAKLATQRRRRHGVILRGRGKVERREKLKKFGILGLNGEGRRPEELRRKKSRLNEEATLCITPGTEFMEKAKDAVLYWAWQRLNNPTSLLRQNGVRIYISTSNAPGEGEVKLLDWIFLMGEGAEQEKQLKRHHKRTVLPNDTVAIMGGDSDLVLEGLILPPRITHNVFVILSDGNRKSHSVSLWETTLTLNRFLKPHILDCPQDIMRVRRDLVLLLIMNGNDYLPKLRGSAGFQKLFHTYLRLLKEWLKRRKEMQTDGAASSTTTNTTDTGEPFLISEDETSFNIPFCLAFFRKLERSAPFMQTRVSDFSPYQKSITPLSNLNVLVDSGFLPKPASWDVLPSSAPEQSIVKLTIGDPLDKHYVFELQHEHNNSLKTTKHRLAAIAIEDVLGVAFSNQTDADVTTADELMDDDLTFSTPTYSWEVSGPVPCDVASYLDGILWNLQTYQEGVCSDYNYNYGRRMSPTAFQIVSYLKNITDPKHHNLVGYSTTQLSRTFLGGGKVTFTEPLNAGLSCLAALPLQSRHLVPQPYNLLTMDNHTVEDIYGQCMDPHDNVFDLKMFQTKCIKALSEKARISKNNKHNVTKSAVSSQTDTQRNNKYSRQAPRGRKIHTSSKFWTVISFSKNNLEHPFAPPEPFSDYLSTLKPNRNIKATRMLATNEPLWFTQAKTESKTGQNGQGVASKLVDDLFPPVAEQTQTEKKGNFQSVFEGEPGDLDRVTCRTAFDKARARADRDRRKKRKVKDTTEVVPGVELIEEEQIIPQKKKHRVDPERDIPKPVHEKMEILFNLQSNLTALACLQCLLDVDVIPGPLNWEIEPVGPPQSETTTNGYVEKEDIRLILGHDTSHILFQVTRGTNEVSRKAVKQRLASMALDDFVGPDWIRMTMKEMKNQLKVGKKNPLPLP